MSRLLSYTEISTALQCFAQWDFAYGGRLAGSSLKPRETALRLSNGRAWGAGVAAWHSTGDIWSAYTAMWNSLNEDASAGREKGVWVEPERLVDQCASLGEILEHYIATTERLPNLSLLEGELNVPIPSRNPGGRHGARRGSSRYRFHCFLDGHSTSSHPWIVEFKLRDSLTDPEIVELQPQYRWYALAYALKMRVLDRPVGVLLDERVSYAPQPVNLNKNGKPSHDKRQRVTAETYLATCAEHGVDPSPDALATFRDRQWHQRIPLVFTPPELAEAARELTGAAQLIRDLDAGRQYPIRNGKPANCRYCKFKAVCSDPHNDFVINSLYTRTEPKRLRPPRPEGVR